MKIRNIIILSFSILLISAAAYSQDKRTIETKVADLLAMFPANDLQLTSRLMNDMLSLGESGIRQICDQIIPVGTSDDTRARFAVESLSRYLSQNGKEAGKEMWEKICISYAVGQKDNSVKDFFMKQLQQIGGDLSVRALSPFLADKNICGPALGAINSIGGKSAESVLAESLKNRSLPCAAAVMNSLALMKSQIAVAEYINWSSDNNFNTKAAAYNALAKSGSPLAYPVLSKAAKDVFYKWEGTGATSSLLSYAKVVGLNGDVKTADKICKLVIDKCDDITAIQNKTAALDTYVGFHGAGAMPLILTAAGHISKVYRNAAMSMSLRIPGSEVTLKWMKFFPKAIPDAKPEIIYMLGTRKDEQSLSLINASLSHSDVRVRVESAAALAKVSGIQAVPALIDYMMRCSDPLDQEAAKSAFMSVANGDKIALLKPVLRDGQPAAKKSAIELMAWNKGQEYFSEVFPYTSSPDASVKTAAFEALDNLSAPSDQAKLIELLLVTENPELISDVQTAIINSALLIADPEGRSYAILKALDGKVQKEKLIPVLSKTGGRDALKRVLDEFENGSIEMREVCFKSLTNWRDYSASSALFEICASGNKTYEAPAFEGYLRQIRSTRLPDEQKLLLLRKIMPYALGSDRKIKILAEIGKLRTYPSLFFVANYLDDPETSAAAAKSAMSIALPSVSSKAGMYGNIVKDILSRTVPRLKGQENEYDKEMIRKYLSSMPLDEGFKSMFNGMDMTGWQGLVEDPIKRAKMKPEELAKKQIEANKKVPLNWTVKDGCICFSGAGANLCSIKNYADFEMLVDWKISRNGDSGIYLRGSPQVQIWDTSNSHVGSGGLYNNKINISKPLEVADNIPGEWNSYRIIMSGEKVSVWLNGILVVDNVTLENYWDRSIPIFPNGAIELQAHGTDLAFRDIYVREINEKEFNLTPAERAEGFIALFNGRNLNGWIGDTLCHVPEDNMIKIKLQNGKAGNLFTKNEYTDFIFRFEFQLTPAANNGVGIRAPLSGDAAYAGMELQILDDSAPVYNNLQSYQYNGSVYGVLPAKRGYLKPVGEWNYEEVFMKGTQIRITLNGNIIVDGDIAGPGDNGTLDHNDHPGLKNKTGHIGFLGHNSVVNFRNIRIKDLSQ
jgi:HEAT repeat protein